MVAQLDFNGSAAVFIVDDDEAVREMLSLLLRIEGYETRAFADAGSFLDAVRQQQPCCIILDLNLPDESGLAVLRQLPAIHAPMPPVLVISGHGDIATAVAAMKFGAVDFLEKPFAANAMVARVRDTVAVYRRAREAHIEGLADFAGLHLLTCRERDVLLQVTRGASNKEAGRRLGISPRTVEVHRARIMDKLGARNTADLMRIVLSADAGRCAASPTLSLLPQ
ncbi:MAG: response regulator [Xanthobacteraceae bacterium]